MAIESHVNSTNEHRNWAFLCTASALRMRAVLVLLPTVFTLSACAKRDAADPAQSKTGSGESIELKELRPESGGEMVLIAAGQFTMGDADGRPDETPHEVYVNSIYMDRYPISQEIFQKVMGTNPSKRKSPNNPVERMQWRDAARFCNKCSDMEGLTPCYELETWECDFEADGYRLPTEAEWEYACRAGSQTNYFFGDDEAKLPNYAWFKPHSRGRPRSVGRKRANQWGLYDMHGNVWEWCNDHYSKTYYSDSPRKNPRGPATGKKRVLRGGAWNSTAEACRAACRFYEFPVFTDACFGSDSYGFRRVRIGAASFRNQQSLARAGTKQVHGKESRNFTSEEPVVSTQQPVAPQPAKSAVPATTLDGTIDPSRLTGTIIFVSDRGGALDIWKMRPSGKDLKQLTHDSDPDAAPRFSPDGKRIMYTSLRDGFPEVWVMNRDGSEQKRLTEGAQGAWSPDGKSILLIRDDQAYIRELASGAERTITPNAWRRCGVPTWNPDGKHVAVASRHLENIGIFILSIDGKTHHQLQTEDPCCTPQWSRDGKRIIFQTVKGHIHQIDIENEIAEQVTFGADIQHDGRYSPDGSMIVFCRAPTSAGPWQICITDLESDDLDFVPITSKGSNSLPDWHSSVHE